MKDKQIIYLSIILVVTLLAFQFDVLYYIFKEKHEHYTAKSVNWYSDGEMSPTNRLQELIQEFGPPDSINPNKGGMAEWNRKTIYSKTGFLKRIVIRDEMIPHNHPAPHFDFLYAYYHLHVPEHLIDAVNGISESIAYDSHKQEVRARCHFMGANYATLVLAMKIVKGELTGYEAKNAYAKYIFKTVKDHPMYDPIAENKYKYELKQYHNQHKIDCLPNEKNPNHCRA